MMPTEKVREESSLTIPLKSCQSPKFISISFFSSSRLHWDSTRPFILACHGQGKGQTGLFTA